MKNLKIIIVTEHCGQKADLCWGLFGEIKNEDEFLGQVEYFNLLFDGWEAVMTMITNESPPELIIVDEFQGNHQCIEVLNSINSFREAGFKGRIVVIDNAMTGLDWRKAGADYSGNFDQAADYIRKNFISIK